MALAIAITVLMLCMLVAMILALAMMIAPEVIDAWIEIKEKIRKLKEMEGKE